MKIALTTRGSKKLRDEGKYSRKTEKAGNYYTEEIGKFIKRNKEWKEVKEISTSILTTEADGKKQEHITNIAGGTEEFVRAVRGHWAIEIYHWILDM